MNYLLGVEEKQTINHPIADLPLNQAFWGMVEKNMTRGEIREFFLGDKGASERPELQYIPSDPAFIPWQGQLLAISAQKKQMADQDKQVEAQQQQQQQQQQQEQEQQSHEKQLQLQQEQREQEQHDVAIDNHKDQKAQDVVNYSQQLQESAKQFGASGAGHVGGKVIKNPLNNT
jgi:hypothetical protein